MYRIVFYLELRIRTLFQYPQYLNLSNVFFVGCFWREVGGEEVIRNRLHHALPKQTQSQPSGEVSKLNNFLHRTSNFKPVGLRLDGLLLFLKLPMLGVFKTLLNLIQHSFKKLVRVHSRVLNGHLKGVVSVG